MAFARLGRARMDRSGAKRSRRHEQMVNDNRNGCPLLDRGGDRLLSLDVTELSASEAAQKIAAWLG